MKTISKLKKDYDKWFSIYIRIRDSENGNSICFTCNKIDHYKKLQNGHFQSRRHNSTRWDLKNCQVQCVKCNMPCTLLKICVNSGFHDGFLIPF